MRKATSSEELEDLGTRMEALAEELLAGGEPSRRIPDESDEPARI